MSLADYWSRIKGHESEIQLILIVMLTGTLIFSLWQFSSYKRNSVPVTIEGVPGSEPVSAPTGDSEAVAKITEVKTTMSGQFVASKNGTKYYLPTCAGASRIKAENRIYFKTVQEARAKGLTPAANCAGL